MYLNLNYYYMSDIIPRWMTGVFVTIFTTFFSIHLLNNSLDETSKWMVLSQITTLAFIGSISIYKIRKNIM